MGKVTIIIESNNVNTQILYEATKRSLENLEEDMKSDIDGPGESLADVRVYIVPGDEE